MKAIVTFYLDGKPHGHPMTDMREQDLFWIVKKEVERGLTAVIEPVIEQDSEPDNE